MGNEANERLGEIAGIRAKLKSDSGALAALKHAIGHALKDHGIESEAGVIDSIVIALPEELSDNLNNVILPGGTNCAASA